MKVILGVALVILIAFLGSRWTFTRVRLPLSARPIYLTGSEFLLVGLALGGLFIGLLDAAALRDLNPLIQLSLGWIGLIIGTQLELAQIRRFPSQYFQVTLLQALLTLGGTFGLMLLLLGWLPQLDTRQRLLAAALLASAAVPTSQAALALAQEELGRGQGKVIELLRYIAGLDDLIGLLPFGFLFCLMQPRSFIGGEQLVSVHYLVLSLLIGLLAGTLLHLLTRVHCSQEELLLFTVGTVLFSAGGAALVGLSALFVTLVGGSLLANVQSQKLRITRVLVLLEKPFYIVLIIMAGALIRPVDHLGRVLLLALAFFVLRLALKTLAGLFASRLFRRPLRFCWTLGLGLTPQGGLAVAMAIGFQRAFADPLADAALIIVLASMVLSELFSPPLVGRALEAKA